ncbi:MAG: D-arabinono-1,4-lactone oxidase [Chloroflexota bacterium]
MKLRNWAGNYRYQAGALHRPESLDELSELVSGLPKVKVVGSRHSFNDVADTPGDLISLERLPRRIEIDRERGRVTIDGASRYGDICGPLDEAGFALHNLASLPHIAVSGSCATGTHGSGDRSGGLATSVVAMELIGPSGDLVRVSREDDGEPFDGMVVALGGLGVVVGLTLELEPTYRMRQVVYRDLSRSAVDAHFDEITIAGDSVSLFTRWRPRRFEQVWVKRRFRGDEDEGEDAPAEILGARLATESMHPIPGLSPTACTTQLGIPGRWDERLPHFRLDHTPSAGDELQSEYVLDRRQALDAIASLDDVGDRIAPVVQVSEVRTIASDRLWLSPAFARDSVSIHFTWIPDPEPVLEVMALVEERLAPFEPRPHWGKLFGIEPEQVAARYPRMPDFAALLAAHDAGGKFRGPFLDRYVPFASARP